MSCLETFGKIKEISKIGEAEFSKVEWHIREVLALLGRNNNYCRSPTFSISNEEWCLRLYLNRKSKPGLLRIGLVRRDIGQPKTFHVFIGIKVPGGLEKVTEAERDFPDDCDYLYHHGDYFCSRSYLEEHRERLMPGGILVIACAIKWVGAATGDDVLQSLEQNVLKSGKNITLKEQGLSNDAEDNYDDDEDGEDDNDKASRNKDNIKQQDQANNAKKSSSNNAEGNYDEDGKDDNDKASRIKDNIKHQDQANNAKKRFETLVKDFGELLSSGEGSDVTVQVGDAEFRVHRIILSARSPVLSAMFKHETEERDTNKVTICDCEPQVFKEYLKYLYTGSVEHLSEQNVFHLLRVADKYLAEELKEQCLMHIRDTLSVQTFCDTVKLALTHGDSGLLQQAIDFASENIRSIICTVEWQNFIREHPTEANEVLIKSLGPQCACQKSKQ